MRMRVHWTHAIHEKHLQACGAGSGMRAAETTTAERPAAARACPRRPELTRTHTALLLLRSMACISAVRRDLPTAEYI